MTTSTQQTSDTVSQIEVIKEPTWKSGWRPALAWAYLFICLFDFIVAPTLTGVMYSVQQPVYTQMKLLNDDRFTKEEIIEIVKNLPQPEPYKAWQPLTLQAGGIFHIFMGAILGIGSWGRSREKVARLEKGIYSDV